MRFSKVEQYDGSHKLVPLRHVSLMLSRLSAHVMTHMTEKLGLSRATEINDQLRYVYKRDAIEADVEDVLFFPIFISEPTYVFSKYTTRSLPDLDAMFTGYELTENSSAHTIEVIHYLQQRVFRIILMNAYSSAWLVYNALTEDPTILYQAMETISTDGRVSAFMAMEYMNGRFEEAEAAIFAMPQEHTTKYVDAYKLRYGKVQEK